MEKRKPHCPLSRVRALVRAGAVRATVTALNDAAIMGFVFDEMVTVVSELTASDFFKSMTTYADHMIWQDAYRPKTDKGEMYVKLTVIDDVLIVSFKAL